MVFQDFLSFLVFLETSEVAGPGPNPREIEISFGADGPPACVRGRCAPPTAGENRESGSISTRRAGYVDTLLVFPSTPASHMASTAVRYPTPQRVDGSTQHTSVEVTDPLLCPPELDLVTRVSPPHYRQAAQTAAHERGFKAELPGNSVGGSSVRCASPLARATQTVSSTS